MVSEELVEATWRESAALPPRDARKKILLLGKLQPALLAFVLAECENHLSPEAAQLANYLFFVIARMFYAAYPKVRRVTIEAVESCVHEVESKIEALDGAHDRFLERAPLLFASRQPHVFRYAVEAIVEAQDDEDEEDPVSLSDDEVGEIFLILATVIKALDEKGLPVAPGTRGEAKE